ncbi:hypothetical protein D0X99_07130 [Algoriphagus lacus]|uniref:Uncharacterized protein n=1 Tax=Algoriphagus lacus TaxID=2056311 RepID=A0A418PUX2_9BACT|nr:hypothetical protein [Algoriphagus lacus]RIW17488.1 hypothetical protein D0X99_07130 [Algoriphagus lacus]
MMELKDFIKETLTQSALGVSEAQESLQDSGAIIAPQLTVKNESSYSVRNDGFGKQAVNEIKFNVGVSIQQKEGNKTFIGVVTGFLSAGGQTQSEKGKESISKIEFSIPVVYPPGDVSEMPKPKKFGIIRK